MSTPLLQQDVKHAQTKRQRALMVIACVLPVIFAAVAMPMFIGGSDEPEPAPDATQLAAAGATATAVDPVKELIDEPEVDPDAIVASLDGDLAVALVLEAASLKAGQPLTAAVEYANHSMDDLHLPAAGEPNGTLAVVVLDAEGMEVRRIVEKGQDPLPGRTMVVATATRRTVPVTILARGEAPLAPGKYSAHVEFHADPHWKRLGLRTWSAPKGTIRSFPVFFEVAD